MIDITLDVHVVCLSSGTFFSVFSLSFIGNDFFFSVQFVQVHKVKTEQKISLYKNIIVHLLLHLFALFTLSFFFTPPCLHIYILFYNMQTIVQKFTYDLALWIFNLMLDIFFREVRTRGSHKIPKDGPVIFVVAPHANQVKG